MVTLFTNIKQLVQVRPENIEVVAGAAMKELPIIENAYLEVSDELITGFGKMENCPKNINQTIVDCSGSVILPSWIDSHTHLVYAGNRVHEFVDRINGLSYEEIANKGGGILNSAKLLQNTPEDELYKQAVKRLNTVIKMGTGAKEIKSGYGLTPESEIKMLRVIKRLKDNFSLPIKATFLGAHAFPIEFKDNHTGYIDLIINEMLPLIAKENLADYIDAFCETGYFSVHETERIMEAGAKYGLKAKIHVNQFTAIDGISACVKHNALSVDHLEVLTDQDIKVLLKSNTMPVALPSCSYFISIPYTPARKIIDSGLPLALATDYNPGTTPSGNMNFVVATACIKMKMTPEEAINAATINAAYAMDISASHGSFTIGKKANFIITQDIEHYAQIPYEFATNLIKEVFISGKKA